MARFLLLSLFAALAAGFSPAPRMGSSARASPATSQRLGRPTAVVIDISSTEEFNDALAGANDALVVVDYSTSWCGPCKIIAPKFDEFSEKYKNVAFLKVMGDSSPAADKLMRSQGVRALPSFHFWKNGKQIDSISGAKTQALQDAIEVRGSRKRTHARCSLFYLIHCVTLISLIIRLSASPFFSCCAFSRLAGEHVRRTLRLGIARGGTSGRGACRAGQQPRFFFLPCSTMCVSVPRCGVAGSYSIGVSDALVALARSRAGSWSCPTRRPARPRRGSSTASIARPPPSRSK